MAHIIRVCLEASKTDADIVVEARRRLDEQLPDFFKGQEVLVEVKACDGYRGIRNIPVELLKRSKAARVEQGAFLYARVLRILYFCRLADEQVKQNPMLLIASAGPENTGDCIYTPILHIPELTDGAAETHAQLLVQRAHLTDVAKPGSMTDKLGGAVLSILQSGLIPSRLN